MIRICNLLLFLIVAMPISMLGQGEVDTKKFVKQDKFMKSGKNTVRTIFDLRFLEGQPAFEQYAASYLLGDSVRESLSDAADAYLGTFDGESKKYV